MIRIDEKSAKNYFVENFFNVETDLPMINKTMELQRIIYNLLQEFLNVCKKLDIQTYPIFGTLLGSVRHQGFIPWDDDVDMAMFREDYELFKDNGSEVLSDAYELIDLSKDRFNYRGSYLRLVYTKSTAVEVNCEWHEESIQGIWIDIVPIDCMYEKEELNEEKIKKIRDVQQMLRCKIYNYDEEGFDMDEKTYEIFSNKAKIYSVEELQRLVTELALEGNKMSKTVGIVVMNSQNEFIEEFFRDDFSRTIKWKFEDLILEVPQGYKRILENRYGKNYHKYPPLNQRVPHHKCFYSFNVPYKNYRTRFFDVFKNIGDKKIIIFGAGYIGLNYLAKFGVEHKVEFIVDNDEHKWDEKLVDISFTNAYMNSVFETDINVLNTDLGQIKIKNPEVLKSLNMADYRLIICSSYFREIEKQLRKIGIMDYNVYVQKKEWLIDM